MQTDTAVIRDMPGLAARLPMPAPPGADRPLVILGVAASDPHVVANHLIAMHLRENGFEVVNLGACTPALAFMEAWQRHPSALAILIGSLNGHAVEDLADLALLKRDFQVRCPIIVGGNRHRARRPASRTGVRLRRDSDVARGGEGAASWRRIAGPSGRSCDPLSRQYG